LAASRDLVCGVATYEREVFHAVQDIDTVYVPAGGGSGLSGLIQTRDLLGLKMKIVGVVSDQADCIATLAALLQEKGRMAGKRVAVILCGGNIDQRWFGEIQSGRFPHI
jgi:threonine dehydratase